MKTLIEEIKSVVMGEKKRMSLNVEKKNLKSFLLEIFGHQDSDAADKNYNFSPQYSLTSVKFLIEFLMEEFELVVAEEYNFE